MCFFFYYLNLILNTKVLTFIFKFFELLILINPNRWFRVGLDNLFFFNLCCVNSFSTQLIMSWIGFSQTRTNPCSPLLIQDKLEIVIVIWFFSTLWENIAFLRYMRLLLVLWLKYLTWPPYFLIYKDKCKQNNYP